jgi:DNA-binding NarL/FixJ family response regulator
VTDVRVLVVDDHQAFRQTMAAVVDETPGFRVVATAESGEQSLAVAAEIATDLVLMDVHLPGIDGIEATRRLTTGDNPPVVLLLSTYDDGEVDYRDCGAAAYLTKSAFGSEALQELWSSTRTPLPPSIARRTDVQ